MHGFLPAEAPAHRVDLHPSDFRHERDFALARNWLGAVLCEVLVGSSLLPQDLLSLALDLLDRVRLVGRRIERTFREMCEGK